MPTNFKDAERMLRDFQNLLPQIVGSIVAVVSAIAVIVGLLNGPDRRIPPVRASPHRATTRSRSSPTPSTSTPTATALTECSLVLM